MSIKVQRILNIAMVLIALSTLPFVGLQNIKRFLPVSILIGSIEGINAVIGKKRGWWVFYNKPNSYLFNEFPFNIGVFWIISLWLMKWSYGKFIKFILLNAIGNAFFAYPFAKFARKIKYFTLVRLNHMQFFFYFFIRHFCFIYSNTCLKSTKSLIKIRKIVFDYLGRSYYKVNQNREYFWLTIFYMVLL